MGTVDLSLSMRNWLIDEMGLDPVVARGKSMNDLWNQFLANPPAGGGGTTYTPGNGINVDGSNVISVKTGNGVLIDGSGNLKVDDTKFIKGYNGVVPSGSTTATVTHNLGSTKVLVSLYVTATGEIVDADFTAISGTQITIVFAVAPTSGQYSVTVAAIV